MRQKKKKKTLVKHLPWNVNICFKWGLQISSTLYNNYSSEYITWLEEGQKSIPGTFHSGYHFVEQVTLELSTLKQQQSGYSLSRVWTGLSEAVLVSLCWSWTHFLPPVSGDWCGYLRGPQPESALEEAVTPLSTWPEEEHSASHAEVLALPNSRGRTRRVVVRIRGCGMGELGNYHLPRLLRTGHVSLFASLPSWSLALTADGSPSWELIALKEN